MQGAKPTLPPQKFFIFRNPITKNSLLQTKKTFHFEGFFVPGAGLEPARPLLDTGF